MDCSRESGAATIPAARKDDRLELSAQAFEGIARRYRELGVRLEALPADAPVPTDLLTSLLRLTGEAYRAWSSARRETWAIGGVKGGEWT